MICLLAMSSCNVSNKSDSNTISSNSDNVDTSQNSIEEQHFSELFDDVFIKLTDDVGITSFDECLDYVKSTEFEYKANTPSNEEPGEITITDDSDFHITMLFESQDNGNAFYDVVYSNGKFEGSVMYNRIKKEKWYQIYDATASEKSKKVNSLNDIITFIKNDVPERQKNYSNNVESNGIIDVAFDISHREENGKIIFDVNTNLPDKMILMLSLTNDNYYAQNKVKVNGGAFTSSGFSDKGNKLVGHYKLEISSIFPNMQDSDVVTKIGAQGEFLTGKYVDEEDGMNMISAIFEFDF